MTAGLGKVDFMLRGDSLAYAGLILLWGTSFLLVQSLVAGFGWAAAVSLTCLLVGVTIAGMAIRAGSRVAPRLRWGRMLLLGCGVAVQLVALTFAVDRLGTALAAAAVGTAPLFSTLIGQMWGVERITGPVALGLVVGFVGSVLVLLFPSGGISWDFIVGMFAGLLSAVAAALSSRYAVVKLNGTPPAEVVCVPFLIAAALTAPFALLLPGDEPAGVLDWVWLVVIGVVLSVLWYRLELAIRRNSGARGAVSARSAAMLVALLIGMAVLGESVSFGQLVGVGLLLGGCLLVLGLLPRPWPGRTS